MSASAGWYDDPKDSAKLRYWDGVMWTEHETPKASPSAAQSHIGQAPYVPAGRPQQPAASAPPSFTKDTGQNSGQGTGPYGSETPTTPTHTDPWSSGAQNGPQAYPRGIPAWQQPQQMGVVTLPDGVVLSGWWKRVLARILDNIFATICALPFTIYFFVQYARVMGDWLRPLFDDARAGRALTDVTVPPEAFGYLVPATLISFLVYAIYEVLFLTRTGATPGKRIVGISVRLREVAGPPPLVAVLKRFGVMQGASVLALLPGIGGFLQLFSLVDSLWPLWDPRKQALHDKVAATNVVVGKQPRKGGSGTDHRAADQVGSGGV